MNNSNEDPKVGIQPAPSWAQRVYVPTDEETARWAEEGLPPDAEIVGSIISGVKFVWGLPDKSEIFRLNALRREQSRQFGAPDFNSKDYIKVRTAERSPLPAAYTLAHPPITGEIIHDLIEHNYLVALQVISREVWLNHIKVIFGSESDDSKSIVFEATECPGPAVNRQIRVLRITVHDDGDDSYATYEVLAETTYPHSFM